MNLELIKNYFEIWLDKLEDEEKSKNTLSLYKTSLEQFIKFAEEKNIEEVNKSVVRQYKDFLKHENILGNLKISTLNVKVIVINQFFKYFQENELTVKPERVQNTEYFRDFLTIEDYYNLLQYTIKHNKEREYYLIRTLAETGVRVSELEYFTVQNLSKAEDYITVMNKGKTREVVIPDKLKADLLKYAKKNDITSVIFHGRNKNRLLSRSTIWNHIKNIAEKAEINPDLCYCHAFRHLYSKTFLKQTNSDILSLADQLGHSSVETTRIYTRKSSKEMKNIINKLYDR